MERRVWVKSGVVEAIDARQARLLKLVYEKIVHYYRDLHGTRPCYRHPLSLWRLKKLCNRSHAMVLGAVRFLAHTIPEGSHSEPAIFYDRVVAERNKTHRPYRIFLKEGFNTYVVGGETGGGES